MTARRIGLIVNPVAGMGGPVGLKGTDGVHAEALNRGAVPRAPQRALRCLQALAAILPDVSVVTCTGDMGETVAVAAGLHVAAVVPVGHPTRAQDTRSAAEAMLSHDVDLILLVGGDGTATDVFAAVAQSVPVLGVPAGVKMQSAIFAQGPEAAGGAVGHYLSQPIGRTMPRELMDLDEELLRTGVLAPRLIGHLQVPFVSSLLQNPKRRSMQEERAQALLGQAVAVEIGPDALIAVGPGTTAGAIMQHWGLPHTLLGFDLVRGGVLVQADVQACDLLRHAEELHVVVAPIGGQGFLFGRGNQQLTADVLRKIGWQRLTVVATVDRLASLRGQPLLIDVDDPTVERMFIGMRHIMTGPRRWLIHPIAAPSSY